MNACQPNPDQLRSAGKRDRAPHKPAGDWHSILIADDSEDDRFLLKTAIQRVPQLKVVAEVSNGTEVIAYLRGLGQFSDRGRFPVPDLLFLDLNMPFKDGFEVLAWLKTQRFENLTVVVLTDSVQPEHIKRALDLGAHHYQVKTRSNDERYSMVLAFEEYLRKAASRSFPAPRRTAGP